jgi:hypothetical protein
LLSAPPPPSADGGLTASGRPVAAVTVHNVGSAPTTALSSLLPKGAAANPWLLKIVAPVLGIAVILGLWLLLRGPNAGQLVVTVSGPNNETISDVQIFVDGQQVCDASPCRVSELLAGTHLIRAAANGFASTADQAVVIQAGQASAQSFALAALKAQAPAAAIAVAQAPQPQTQAQPEPASEETVKLEAAGGTQRGRVEAKPRAEAEPKQASSKAANAAAAAAGAKSKKGTNGTLNLTSTPPSTIVLDGNPLGRTPRTGVSVSPGSHTVVFVNPQRGRKTVKVQVSAGGNKNVSVRF